MGSINPVGSTRPSDGDAGGVGEADRRGVDVAHGLISTSLQVVNGMKPIKRGAP